MRFPLAYSAGDCDHTGATSTWHSQHIIGDTRSARPALCARSAQSRAHTLPRPTPQTLRPQSLLKAPLRRASPTPPPPPFPHPSTNAMSLPRQLGRYCSRSTSLLSDGCRSLHARVASENGHERPPRCSWSNLSPSVAELTSRCAYELQTRDTPSCSSWVAATILPSFNRERAAFNCRCAASPVQSAAGCRFGRRRRRGRVFLRYPKHRHQARCKLAQH